MFIGTFVFENPSDIRIGAYYTNSAYSLTNYMYIDVELVKKYGYHPSLIFVGVKKPDFEYEHYPVYVNRYENNIKRLSLLKNNKLVCFATGITKEGEKLYFAVDTHFILRKIPESDLKHTTNIIFTQGFDSAENTIDMTKYSETFTVSSNRKKLYQDIETLKSKIESLGSVTSTSKFEAVYKLVSKYISEFGLEEIGGMNGWIIKNNLEVEVLKKQPVLTYLPDDILCYVGGGITRGLKSVHLCSKGDWLSSCAIWIPQNLKVYAGVRLDMADVRIDNEAKLLECSHNWSSTPDSSVYDLALCRDNFEWYKKHTKPLEYTRYDGRTEAEGIYGDIFRVQFSNRQSKEITIKNGSGYSLGTLIFRDSQKFSIDIDSITDSAFGRYGGYTIELKRVNRIDAFAFKDSKIEYMEIPETTKIIEDKAFSGCTGLKQLVIKSENLRIMSVEDIYKWFTPKGLKFDNLKNLQMFFALEEIRLPKVYEQGFSKQQVDYIGFKNVKIIFE